MANEYEWNILIINRSVSLERNLMTVVVLISYKLGRDTFVFLINNTILRY